MISSYTRSTFTQHITDPIETIFECGSRDCLDAIEMLHFYKPKNIYSFECNPESIVVCRENIKQYPNIILVESAVSDHDGIIDFYATDMEKSIDKNIGASSALFHRDQVEFIQKKIQVPCITLNKFIEKNNITAIDLLCLDLQGYEKIALDGLFEKTNIVKYIISEISYKSFYHNDMLFGEYKSYLESKGFAFLCEDSGDALFKNTRI